MNRYIATLAILLAFFATSVQAGIVIGGTRVIYNGDKKETSVSINNTSKTDVYLVQSWVDAGSKSQKAPFIVTPPLFRINPEEENMLRIVRVGGALKQDRESVFWLNIKSIPAINGDTSQTNTLQVVIKSRLKLFYRPDGLEGRAEDAWQKLNVTRSGKVLTINNPTPYFVTLFSLKVDGREIEEADLLPPEEDVRFTLPSANGSSVSWQAINDYGGISPSVSRRL
ncbi:molecular chaperone [Enterobacter chuandaensis]|uniref:fimbrial biogenesis chaperone n=1 Tax=Enterobacter chuandaensis TaxID=2497875 RepID=UPI002074EC79|nr:molecular chaperone [Enterobacter chuandaensis]MCM7587702.1 molecular chaperone [Enterobacter chuandaensis]